MNGQAITKMGAVVFAAVVVCGCQVVSRAPSDADIVFGTMTDWSAALVAQDLDKVMAVYSEDYVSTRGGGKESVREFMTRAFERGYMDNVKINLEGTKTMIEGDKAEFGPVEFVSDRGTMRIEYTLQKENGAWLIIGSKRQEQ